jgi:hypothetical protein
MRRRDKRKRDQEAEEERGVEAGFEDLSLKEGGREGVAFEESCRGNHK